MSVLRWLGLLVGAGLLLHSFARFRDARSSRVDFVMGVLLGGGAVTVSAFPDSVNLLRDMLMLEREQWSRLIAVLIASSAALWVVLLATRSRVYRQADQFDHLVRALGLSEFRRLYPGRERLPEIVVVIPAYAERDNIGAVLEAMPGSVCGLDLVALVIDDGSPDDTAEVARRHGALVVRTPVRRGGGAALRLGFDIALQHGARVVVTMDADGQHLPSEIETLVRPVLESDTAFVIGSRILGRHESESRLRRLGIHVFNVAIRLLSSVKVTDCSNGFRALRTAELGRLQLRQDQFHTAELIIDAAKRGIRIGEVPVTVARRASGESKKGRDWAYGLSFARTVFRTWWRY